MLKITRNKTIYCWLERLFLGLLALYLLKSAEYMTTFNLSPFVPAWTDQFLLITLSVVTIPKTVFLLLSDPIGKAKHVRLIAYVLVVSLLWLVVYLNDRYVFLLYFSVLTLGCVGTDYRTLLKVQVCVVGAVVFAAALCCMVGAIENRVYWGHGTIRSSFGYTYPTNMAAYYVFIIIAAWIAWDEVWDPVFLLLGFLSLFISGVIADSKTSFLCSLLFVAAVFWCWLIRNKTSTWIIWIQNVLGFLCRIAFPLCGAIAILLTVAFHQGLPYMEKLNEWTSNRLAQQTDAFYQYGVHLFGRAFEMHGLTSVFPVLNYNYVDCSYLQLLLRCGALAFLLYLVLWPMMTGTAIKAGKYRLSMGLALIALHSLSEHRFLVVDYNLLFVAPFAVIAVGDCRDRDTPRASPESTRASGSHLALLFTGGLLIMPALFFWKPILSGARTMWTVLLSQNMTLQLYQRRTIFFVSICFIYSCVFLAFLIFRIVSFFLHGEKPKLWYSVAFLLCFAAGSAVLVKANDRLDRAMAEYEDVLEEDTAFVSLAKNVDGLHLYDAELPMLYDRRYGGFSTSFFNGEDLARVRNLAVITDSDHQWPSMFQRGFSYSEISDHHAVYTDSPELLQAMDEYGYDPVPYYSKEMSVKMRDLAEWNRITPKSDESLTITSERPILNVPDVDLRPGNYTFFFDLSLQKPSDIGDRKAEDTAFMIGFSDNAGARQLFERAVTFGEFDEDGKMDLQVSSFFNAAGVEFTIVPAQGVALELYGVSYRITS